MEWIDAISEALHYIEEHISDDLTLESISRHIYVSPFYFQKGFSMLCGFSVHDYIKQRRLAQAGIELMSSDDRIIDIALKYGYTSADSFTKAFTRFHGITPSAARKKEALIKSFAPLKISFTLKGGYIMDYKVVKKEAFKVLAVAKTFSYEDATTNVPQFWSDHYQNGLSKFVCGAYGINVDESMEGKEFEYLIADDYKEGDPIPQGCILKTIPAFTWAVFPCKGSMPNAMQSVNQKLFTEWLPNCKEYEFAAGYNIEMYNDPSDYPKGVQDENYYSEIWIPIKKK